jgi:hypothetical protein
LYKELLEDWIVRLFTPPTYGAEFLIVLLLDSRLESIVEKRGWGSPESPKRLMTPAVQQQLAGVFSFICRAVRFSAFLRADS